MVVMIPQQGKAAAPNRRRAVLIVPAYNEALEIAASLTALDRYLCAELPAYDWELLVVDDGSTDGTVAAVRSLAPALTVPIRVVEHVENSGLGQALRTGFAHATGDVVVTMDADLSYDVGHIGRLVQAWESTGAAIVLASPYMPGGSTVAVPRQLRTRSRWANRYLTVSSGRRLRTFTGMVRAYDGRFLRNLVIGSDGVVINVELIRKACILGLPVVEIPAVLNWSGLATRQGRTRVVSRRAWRETRRTLREGLLFRPRLYLVSPGLLLALVALVVMATGAHAVGRIFAIAALAVLLVGVVLGLGYRRDFREFREDFALAAMAQSWPERSIGRWTSRRRPVAAPVAVRDNTSADAKAAEPAHAPKSQPS